MVFQMQLKKKDMLKKYRMNNSAICLLCVRLNKIHIDFFNTISNYKLFMLCDDNNSNTNTNIQNIEIIK